MTEPSTWRGVPSRRTVLVGAVGAALALGAALAAGLPGVRSAAAAVILPRRPSAAALGRRYLIQHPEERAVVRGLAAGLRALSAGMIRARIAADFRNGDIVDLGGWRLARTECRLGALAALA